MQSHDKKRTDKPMDVLFGYILWSLWASPDKYFKVTDFYIGNEYPQSGSQSYCCFFFQRRKKAALKRALFFPLGPPVRIQSLPLMWLWGTYKALITDSRYHNNTTLSCALVCFFPTSLSFWLAACKTSAFIGRKLNSIYKVGTFIWNW